jgi:hypothetical protein
MLLFLKVYSIISAKLVHPSHNLADENENGVFKRQAHGAIFATIGGNILLSIKKCTRKMLTILNVQ